MNKIVCLKMLDRTLGKLVCFLFKKNSANLPDKIKQVLFVRPGGIGDAALLAPAIKTFKKSFPQAECIVLAERRNAGVFELIPGINQVFRYDVPAELLAAFRLKPDIAIDTEQYHRLSAVVARFTTAASLIGFGTNERARLFHYAIPYSHDNYEVESFISLLVPLGIKRPSIIDVPFLSVPMAALSKAAQLLAPFGGQLFIVIFPGASIPERRWGTERFQQVAIKLRQHGYGIVVVGGKEDTETGAAIVNGAGLNLAGQTSLAETAAILNQAALLISGDSGVLHIGVGLGTPTVSLFGPGIERKWAPHGPQHIVLNQQLACSPCTRFGYTRKCPHQAECLQRISPEIVIEAALSLLSGIET